MRALYKCSLIIIIINFIIIIIVLHLAPLLSAAQPQNVSNPSPCTDDVQPVHFWSACLSSRVWRCIVLDSDHAECPSCNTKVIDLKIYKSADYISTYVAKVEAP